MDGADIATEARYAPSGCQIATRDLPNREHAPARRRLMEGGTLSEGPSAL